MNFIRRLNRGNFYLSSHSFEITPQVTVQSFLPVFGDTKLNFCLFAQIKKHYKPPNLKTGLKDKKFFNI